jgi:hypothetical protein
MIKYEPIYSSLKLKRTDSTTLTSIELSNGKKQILSIPSLRKIKKINEDILYKKNMKTL